MTQILFYKMTNDSGAAPCVRAGRLSLAICKPMIRISARKGDLVFGFAASSLHPDNRLIYIAQVTEVLAEGRYYEAARFARRPDCIYERRGKNFVPRAGARFHDRPGDLEHDLGPAPQYPRASVLLSTDFRYLGAAGSADYKRRFPRLRRAIEELKQGHRRFHSTELLRELRELKDRVWRKYAAGHPARPSSAPDPRACHRGGACGVVTGRPLPSRN